jgi:ankyrin repeat protein
MRNLHEAARSGNLHVLQSALSRGFSVDTPNESKWTLLHFAVLGHQVEVARYLLSRKANINAHTVTGASALHIAARAANPVLSTLLIENGGSLTSTDANGQTPLHHAVLGQSPVIVRLLLDFRADPNALDLHGFGPLHLAVDVGCESVVHTLLSGGANPSLFLGRESFWTPLHIAAKHGYVDILTALLKAAGDATVRKRPPRAPTPLHIAASQRPEGVSALLAHGADALALDANGEPPLFLAIRARALDNVRLLCDPQTVDARNKFGQYPLHAAAEAGFPEIIRFLLGQRAGHVHVVDAARNTPLHVAVARRHREAAEIFLEAGADVMARNLAGESAFGVAAGDFRLILEKFAFAHPDDCRPVPIERASTAPRTGKIAAIASPPGRLGNRESQGSHASREEAAVEIEADDVEGMENAIEEDIGRARAEMAEQVDALKKLLVDLREDAQL